MELIDLIRLGDLKLVKRFLEAKKGSLNAKDSNGMTALHHAASTGDMETAKLLLVHNVDVNVRNNLGFTPFHCAVLHRMWDMIEFLFDKADFEEPSNDGWTPLHSASQLGDLEIVQFLVERNAEIDSPNSLGLAPLHLAVSRGNILVVKYLISKGAEFTTDEVSYSPLHVASLIGQVECAEYLIQMGANVNLRNGQGNTPLHLAALEGEHEIVEILLDNNADAGVLNASGRLPCETTNEQCRFRISEAHVSQIKRNESSVNMYNAVQTFGMLPKRLPWEIECLILSFLSNGFQQDEFLLMSKLLLTPTIFSKLRKPKNAFEFLQECKKLI